jgi:hypothetical protein
MCNNATEIVHGGRWLHQYVRLLNYTPKHDRTHIHYWFEAKSIQGWAGLTTQPPPYNQIHIYMRARTHTFAQLHPHRHVRTSHLLVHCNHQHREQSLISILLQWREKPHLKRRPWRLYPPKISFSLPVKVDWTEGPRGIQPTHSPGRGIRLDCSSLCGVVTRQGLNLNWSFCDSSHPLPP